VRVEVAYALPDRQTLLAVEVGEGVTLDQAVRASGILERHPDIDWPQATVGVFGQRCDRQRLLRPGDRVEIYRPLLIDPKQARRQRAEDRRKSAREG